MSDKGRACAICEVVIEAPPFCVTCGPLARRRFGRKRGRRRDRVVDVPTGAQWRDALRAAWDRDAKSFRCGISGVRLDPSGLIPALYPTLDHASPGRGAGGWLVVAAAINDMKSDLDLDEAKRAWALLSAVVGGTRSASDELERLLSGLKHFRSRAAPRG